VIFGVPPKIRVTIHEKLREPEGAIRGRLIAGINFRHYLRKGILDTAQNVVGQTCRFACPAMQIEL